MNRDLYSKFALTGNVSSSMSGMSIEEMQALLDYIVEYCEDRGLEFAASFFPVIESKDELPGTDQIYHCLSADGSVLLSLPVIFKDYPVPMDLDVSDIGNYVI